MASSSATITINIKELDRLKCIELPCFVKDGMAALDMLGGKESVFNGLLQEDISCQFRFPGSNPLRSNLTGSISGKQGVIIKVVRKKRTKQIMRTEVVGRVHQKVIFDNPADYQVIMNVKVKNIILSFLFLYCSFFRLR